MSTPLMDTHTEKKTRKTREVPMWALKLVLLLAVLLLVVPVLAMLASAVVSGLLVITSNYTVHYGDLWLPVTLVIGGLLYAAVGTIIACYYRLRWIARHRRKT